MKANKDSRHLSRLQECSRTVNVMAANVVASTKSGQEQIEDRGDGWGPGSGVGGVGAGAQALTLSLVTDTMDFSGMSLIKLKKQEMETQVGACANPTATPLPRCSGGLRACPSPGAELPEGSAEWCLPAGSGPGAGEDAGGGACAAGRASEATLRAGCGGGDARRGGAWPARHCPPQWDLQEAAPGPEAQCGPQAGPPGRTTRCQASVLGWGGAPEGAAGLLLPGLWDTGPWEGQKTLTSRSKMLTQQHGGLGSLKRKM